MSKLMKPVIAGVCLASLSMPVLAEVSGNVAITSDYRFRGISQNDKTFAIQGGFDYKHDEGFYVGVWGSSVDFQVTTVDDATAEFDIYAGYGGEFGDSGIGYDVNILRFAYPNSDSSLNYDFTELTVGLSYEILNFSISKTSDYFAGSGDATYYKLSAEYPVSDDWTLSASIGQQDVEDNAAWGTPNWQDYKIAISGSLGSVNAEIAYIDTNLSKSECFGGSNWCDSTVTFTLSKSL